MATTQDTREILAEIEQRFNELSDLWARLQQKSHDVLLRKPSADGWSANECLKHLNSYGRYYLPLFDKALKEPSVQSKNYREGWLGGLFIRWMSTSAEGYPEKTMSAPPGHRPKNNLLVQETLSEFEQQYAWLQSLMHLVAGHDLAGTRIPISIGKWIRLQIGDVLRFYIAHHVRHLHQALRAAQ